MTMQPLAPDDPALRDVTMQYVHETRGVPLLHTVMDDPCAHVYPDGRICGLSWKIDNDTIRPEHNPRAGHSFRPKPLEQNLTPPESVGIAWRSRALTDDDRQTYGIPTEQMPMRERKPEETYLSEKQAAIRLGVTVTKLRGMIRAKAIESDTIGEVRLIRKASVEMVIALAESIAVAEGDDVAD